MFSHVMLGGDDIAAAKSFYDAALGALGRPPGRIDDVGRLYYATSTTRFLITKPINGEPTTAGNGSTFGFWADSPEAADAWHAAGLAHGGTACEDPPGIRHASGGRRLYIAYLRDPSGNKVCATHLMPA